MNIDFPNSPVNGSTYDFEGIRFTYQGTAPNGYWAILTVGTAGIATIADINTGTDPVKYITPSNLDGSKYTREEETGETNLTFSGLIKATTSGAGLVIDGTVIADNITSYSTDILLNGFFTSGSHTLSQSIRDYDEIGYSISGSSWGNDTVNQVHTVPQTLINYGDSFSATIDINGSNNHGTAFRFDDATTLTITANDGRGLNRIWGTKY